MAGFKDFVDGSPFFAAEVDGYLMRQSVMRFPTTTTLVNQLASGIREDGMLAWADNTRIQYMWDATLGAWVPWFSPEFTFSPIFTQGGVNITFGNSLSNSWWRYSAGMVEWNWRMVIGSTANLGTGIYALSLPISTRAELNQHYVGQMSYFDTSASNTYHRGCVTLGTTTSFGIVDSNGTRMSGVSPIAWANNDQFGISLRYPPSTGTYL